MPASRVQDNGSDTLDSDALTRTVVLLKQSTKAAIEELANKRGVSAGYIHREILEQYLSGDSDSSPDTQEMLKILKRIEKKLNQEHGND